MIAEYTLLRGVVKRRPDTDGTHYWALLFRGDEQVFESGPFDDRLVAREMLISEIQRLKMKEGVACA